MPWNREDIEKLREKMISIVEKIATKLAEKHPDDRDFLLNTCLPLLKTRDDYLFLQTEAIISCAVQNGIIPKEMLN